MPDSSILPKCCLIGEAVAGNPTHFMVERAFASAELDWRFLTFEIDAARLPDALAGADALGISGALLLGSLREAAVDCYPQLTDRVRRTRSATCLAREGDNLVADDLVAAAAEDAIAAQLEIADSSVLLLGAARIAHSLADAVLTAGAGRLVVADRNAESADRLAEKLSADYPDRGIEAIEWDNGPLDFDFDEPVGGGPELVISSACWPKARDAEFASAAEEWVGSAKLVVDARLSASRAAVAHLADTAGTPAIDGLELLTREAATAIHRWTGVLVDRAALREAAEEFLGV